MHPSLSVIFFTTASGAGYGLLALLGVTVPFGIVPPERWFGVAGLGIALALITAGLLSSTAHLSHPERAWRAFSQVRSSWLSREGVAAVATYVPAGLFAIGWIVIGRADGWIAAVGLLAAIGALATVSTTGMIYASLKPIAQWHSPYTLPAYLIFALMTGAVILNALLHLFGLAAPAVSTVAALLIALGWLWKIATWRHDDGLAPASTANSATGLAGGTVRSVEWPHTEENYVLKEMGYRIARKHAARLRVIVHVLAFGLPLALSLIALVAGGIPATLAALAAVLLQAPGIAAERWLFFAGARHTVTLYY
jgi:DMSO reductase anchor subunit